MMNKLRVALLIVVASVLVGCVQPDPLTDLRAFVAEQDARPQGTIPPPPEFVPAEFVSYTVSGVRSPFEVPRPIELVQAEREAPKSNVRPDFDRVKEYLESFRIENLVMVGTLSGFGEDDTLYALVKDVEGEVHRVQVGNHMGRNYGRIIDITESQIDLIEIVPSGTDNWVERPRAIVLVGIEQ